MVDSSVRSVNGVPYPCGGNRQSAEWEETDSGRKDIQTEWNASISRMYGVVEAVGVEPLFRVDAA